MGTPGVNKSGNVRHRGGGG